MKIKQVLRNTKYSQFWMYCVASQISTDSYNWGKWIMHLVKLWCHRKIQSDLDDHSHNNSGPDTLYTYCSLHSQHRSCMLLLVNNQIQYNSRCNCICFRRWHPSNMSHRLNNLENSSIRLELKLKIEKLSSEVICRLFTIVMQIMGKCMFPCMRILVRRSCSNYIFKTFQIVWDVLCEFVKCSYASLINEK